MISISSFSDEFCKIAEGLARIGRRPISVDRLLEREAAEDLPMASDVSAEKTAGPTAKTVATLAAGAGIYHVGRKANEDRKLGKMVRQQQGG
jgi:hypothetical protein